MLKYETFQLLPRTTLLRQQDVLLKRGTRMIYRPLKETIDKVHIISTNK